MNFQAFFYYLGKIAVNLGLDNCAPRDFATAKCVAKAIYEATLGNSGLNADITGTSRTLANNTTFTHTATVSRRYVFTSVTSTNGNQSIFINGVDTTVDLTTATVVGFDLRLGDVLTVVDPASGVGASWVEVLVPLAI
tara:strand:+ start:347 stop:760 length:414 start_codon:yes stop_codon:yes gene_type:complete